MANRPREGTNPYQHELHTFFDVNAAALRLMDKRIALRASEDPGTAGDEVEEDWAQILRDWLPSDYQVVTKGRVLGRNGEAGPQVDIVVLHPAYPRALLRKKLYLAPGVVAAFECKLTLRARDVRKAVENCTRLSAIATPQSGTPYRDLSRTIFYGLLANKPALGRTRDQAPLEHLTALLNRYSDAGAHHPRDLLDLVCIGSVGVVSRSLNLYLRSAALDDEIEQLDDAGADILVGTTHLMQSANNHHSSPDGVPLSDLIARLLKHLAYDDVRVRPLLHYYWEAAAFDSVAIGPADRIWPESVLSPEVLDSLRLSLHRSDSTPWNEWASVL